MSLSMHGVWDIVKKRVPEATTLVALFRVGSHSHGTYVPPEDEHGVDDEDFMAVVAPPPWFVFGIHTFDHAEIKEGALDCVVYSWGKYVRLLLKSNPNVLGTLWVDADDAWAEAVYPFSYLPRHRHLFATKAAFPAFAGYANAQLHKMTHHAHQGYMGEKRKALVAKHGYDTKNAAHLVRLLRMCSEFLLDGQMRVRRPDAAEIVAIKRGAWTLEQVQTEADRLFALCHANLAMSKLPGRPDEMAVEHLLLQVYRTAWQWPHDFTGAKDKPRLGRGYDLAQTADGIR